RSGIDQRELADLGESTEVERSIARARESQVEHGTSDGGLEMSRNEKSAGGAPGNSPSIEVSQNPDRTLERLTILLVVLTGLMLILDFLRMVLEAYRLLAS